MNNMIVKPLLMLSLLGLCFCVTASNVSIPNAFFTNQPAVASEFNANFDTVAISINDNDSNIVTMMSLVSQLQADMA